MNKKKGLVNLPFTSSHFAESSIQASPDVIGDGLRNQSLLGELHPVYERKQGQGFEEEKED
ncbi:MAG: hypothetical protein ABR907_13695 [Terracidiphilus sp.]